VTLEALVGRRLMFGLPGSDLSDADVELFRETQAAGVMLYRRNFETPERLARLLTGLEDALGRRLLIATDHEGGRIIMLGRSVTIFPDNLAAGTAGEINFVHRQGLFEGRELRRLGVDVNFSPVLDVLTERYSPNIGIRSYGKDPALVARYGAARIRGMQSAGVSACAKHFPGKGHAPLDAHLALPMIGSEWSEMHATHLPPFLAAIEAGVDCIMTSHPLYPNLDPRPAMPASFSKLIVEDYLRGQVGYRGVIVSDDLEMGAIGALCPIGEATVRLFVQDTNGVAWLKYQCTAGAVVRAFALDVTVDQGVIFRVSDFLVGVSKPGAQGYGIFPASFRDGIVRLTFSILTSNREGIITAFKELGFRTRNGNPDTLLSSSTFGLALYGRKGRQSGFPAVSPLNETARQIQLVIKVEF